MVFNIKTLLLSVLFFSVASYQVPGAAASPTDGALRPRTSSGSGGACHNECPQKNDNGKGLLLNYKTGDKRNCWYKTSPGTTLCVYYQNSGDFKTGPASCPDRLRRVCPRP